MTNSHIGKRVISAKWIAENMPTAHYFIECFAKKYGVGARRLLKQLVADNFLSRIFIINPQLYAESKACGYDIEKPCEVLGLTALKSALRSGNIEMVRLIIKDGAKLNNSEDIYPSKINCAIDGGCVSCLKLLITEQQKLGIDALHDTQALEYAVSKNNFEMTKTLIQLGADAKKESVDPLTQIAMAPLDFNIFSSDDFLNYSRSQKERTQAIRIIKLLKSNSAKHSEWYLRMIQIREISCPCCRMFK